MRKALFWDFDGTLVEARPLWTRSLTAAYRQAGVDVPEEAVRARLRTGYTWHAPERAYLEHTGSRWWARLFAHLDALHDEYGVSNTVRQAVNARFRALVIDSAHYHVYGDAVPVLRQCAAAGYESYVLSNNYPELPDVLAALGLDRHFATCIVSSRVGYEKPHPALFRHALRLAGEPDEAWMIGDNPIADARGGKAAGLRTILVHAKGEADFVCEELAEIPAILGL